MDRAEGGTALVSAELRERLSQHGAADQETLQFLWKMNVWSVADLAGVDTEALVQVRTPCICALPLPRARGPEAQDGGG